MMSLKMFRPTSGSFLWILFLILSTTMMAAGCSSDDDDGTSSPPGDDDASPGDDDVSPGDDDVSPGDDDVSPGDDDVSPGDDDVSPGDDDTEVVSPTPVVPDADDDGIPDGEDNCVSISNKDQADADTDGQGDVCDPCPQDSANDADGDGKCESVDNCPDVANADQADTDSDGLGDACDDCSNIDEDPDNDGLCGSHDNCPDVANEDQADQDNDGLGDLCDVCPADVENDVDGDGYCESDDNCPDVTNEGQEDMDNDGIGDLCDLCTDEGGDPDGDTVCGTEDNCPDTFNPDQTNSDTDPAGDACDLCPSDPNKTEPGDCGCGEIETDTDGDGAYDCVDNCSLEANPSQMDRDQDGQGDTCDACPDNNPDDNEDGICGPPPETPSPNPTFALLSTNPDDGYMAVSLTPSGSVDFTEQYPGDQSLFHVTIVSQYGEVMPQFLTFLTTSVHFAPTLQPDTDYCMMVEIEYQEDVPAVWPLTHTACFTTRVPCGVPIDVGGNTQIKTLGSGNLVVTVLQTLIETYGNNYPIVFLLENITKTDKFPMQSVDTLLGAYLTDAQGTNTLADDGYTSTFEACTVAVNGALSCAADHATFPLSAGGLTVNLYVTNATISGTLKSTGNITTMNIFNLKGVVTYDDIVRIEQETGVPGVSAAVKLDQDLDGDGTNDAASFWVQTSPQAMTLSQADCLAQ